MNHKKNAVSNLGLIYQILPFSNLCDEILDIDTDYQLSLNTSQVAHDVQPSHPLLSHMRQPPVEQLHLFLQRRRRRRRRAEDAGGTDDGDGG